MAVQDRVRERMEQKESLDNDVYWANLFMLLFITWAVLLYFLKPSFVGFNIPAYAILIILVVAGYGLLVFNQTEILRKRIAVLEEELAAQ